MKNIYSWIWPAWLGGGTYLISGYWIVDWQFWAFFLPLILFILLDEWNKE